MSRMPLPQAEYIDTQESLNRLVDHLSQETLLAVDTESNSLYVYQEQVCLIQVSTRNSDYIIDPLAIDDMSPFGGLMAAEHIEKVFHAAEYDIVCMRRDFGYEFRNLFDTMIAARICGLGSYGLASILETYFGIGVDKSHQRDNWGARPLTADSLAYAQMDTHFLPYLRDELKTELERSGHVQESQETFMDVARTPASTLREFDSDGFWRLKQPHTLDKRQLSIMREVYRMREQLAIEINVPPFKILSNRALIGLAMAAPRNINTLKKTRLLSGKQLRDYGELVIDAIKQGKASKEKLRSPSNEMPDPVIIERYTALHTWRKERASKRGVESDVIISKQALWDLAEKAPESVDDLHQVQSIGPWRLQTYGKEIIEVLNTSRR